MSDMASKGFMGMHKQVYTAHKARVDSMICDALAATDSPSEKLAIIQAHKDALAAFEVPSEIAAPPANDVVEPEPETSGVEIAPARKRKKVPSE